jgi:serine/threonine protein kinase
MEAYAVPGVDLVRRLDDLRSEDTRDTLGLSAGEIYLARRRSDGLEVAVKIYDRRLSAERDRLRFEQEVAALKALADLPHLLAPVDAGVADGRAYVVTPYCPSGSLRDHVLAVGRLTATEVRRIGVKLADGLHRAHEQGIYHRNVKPSNVLIDGNGEPQLADFGLVSLALAGGEYLVPDGPRPYAAPEAFLPELMTAPADIFALGATLFTLLAGVSVPPPVGPEPVQDLPTVPRVVMSVIRRAVAADPAQRYGGASALRDALAATQPGIARVPRQPVVIRPADEDPHNW